MKKMSHIRLKVGFIAFARSIIRISFRKSAVLRLSLSSFNLGLSEKNDLYIRGAHVYMASFIAHETYLTHNVSNVNKSNNFARLVFMKTMDNKKQHLKLVYFILHVSKINTEKITFQLEYTSK